MFSSTLYTWSTPKGILSVYNEGGQHILRLSTRDGKLTDLTDVKIEGDLFETEPEKMVELCKQYLPIVRKEGNTDSLSVVFHLSTVPGSEQADKPSLQDEKDLDIGFAFNNLKSTFFIQFDPKAPNYRRVVRGLNLEGKCQLEDCEALNKNVCVPLGMGKFNVPQEMNRAMCPACDTKLESKNINNLGFWNCKYTIDGMRDAEPPSKEYDTAPSDKYKTFKPSENCKWAYLEVTAEPIDVAKQAAASNNGVCVIL